MAAPPDAMTLGQAARHLALSSDTLRRFIRRGELDLTREGTAVLIARADLDAWVAGHQVVPGPSAT